MDRDAALHQNPKIEFYRFAVKAILVLGVGTSWLWAVFVGWIGAKSAGVFVKSAGVFVMTTYEILGLLGQYWPFAFGCTALVATGIIFVRLGRIEARLTKVSKRLNQFEQIKARRLLLDINSRDAKSAQSLSIVPEMGSELAGLPKLTGALSPPQASTLAQPN
jgi:hypothetical protein